jgi:hypothetical protein
LPPEQQEKVKDIIGEDFSPVIRFFEACIRMTIRPARRVILYRSVVTMAVSAFEVMVAGIISQNSNCFQKPSVVTRSSLLLI